MQTIHIWPANHLLLENNHKARAYRKKLPEGELLVVIEDGHVVEVEPPPGGDHKFRDNNLVQLLERAWSRGLAASTKTGELRAPEGWILWQDLQPGMLAFDGHDQHVLRYPVLFPHEDSRWRDGRMVTQTKQADVVLLVSERTTESVWTFDPEMFRTADFWKVVRQGLTQAQCIEIREMFNRGDRSVLSPTYVL